MGLIRIYTSNFASMKKAIQPVSIAYRIPDWASPLEGYPQLAPPGKLLGDYKAGRVTDEQYTEIYHKEVLSKLNVAEIVEFMEGKTMLCWCGKGKFCHRHIVADWIMNNTVPGTVEVVEL